MKNYLRKLVVDMKYDFGTKFDINTDYVEARYKQFCYTQISIWLKNMYFKKIQNNSVRLS